MTSQNVEASLMEKKTIRRKRGDLPYPVVHSTCMSNFDIWDSMFINSCCRSLSIHQFEKPPAVVLDLGCGTGFWAIEAAKHWVTSTIVGYDIRRMQPKLSDMEPYANISHRVRWVHGNLLDGLDLPSSHFDFVRIVNIGLGVPEDEWQFVFEEIARVMKSGAVLEIIEEDPIFPCEHFPPRTVRWKPRLPPITVNLPLTSKTKLSSTYSSKSSATLTSDPWSSTLDQRFDLRSSKSALSVVSLSPTFSPRSPLSPSSSTNNFTTHETFSSDDDDITDPRNHSKLKEAWEAMLTDKFLSRNLLSILPFYLSSIFVDVRTNPPLKIVLPPNSPHLEQTQRRTGDSASCDWTIPDSIYDSRSCPSTHSAHSDNSLDFDEPQCPFSSTWITMHLARTVRTVQGCKEAIWEEYKKLYSGHMVTHTNRPEAIVPQVASSREAFEVEWASWENDMMDRIGMRGTIFSQFAWSEPPGEHPDWQTWRTVLSKIEAASENVFPGSSAYSGRRKAFWLPMIVLRTSLCLLFLASAFHPCIPHIPRMESSCMFTRSVSTRNLYYIQSSTNCCPRKAISLSLTDLVSVLPLKVIRPMSDTENTPAPTPAVTPEEKKIVSSAEADLTKYKTAADIVHQVTKKLIELSVEGAKVIDLCIEGDKLIEQGTGAVYNKAVKGVKVSKGLAFPTCISVNNAVAHFSPLASDPQSSQVLAKDDVVKIQLGAQIDGFASISAETIVIGATAENPVTGRRADVIKAAWNAAELAMRTIKVGNKNWAVTEIVNRAAAAWDCKPVEGMLSCQQTQNVIDGKKRIILNPSEAQKRDFEAATFAEGEVYGMDILISSGEDGKARLEESRTTIYQRDSAITYQLKMKNSRAVFSEVQKKAGAFPFNIRSLEDEKRSRMGLQEAVQHSLVKPYEVIYTPAGTFVAGFHFTIALLPGGPSLISHPPVWYKAELRNV